jgi:hypothetical protein
LFWRSLSSREAKDLAVDLVFDFVFTVARHSERLFTGAKNPDTAPFSNTSSSFSHELNRVPHSCGFTA